MYRLRFIFWIFPRVSKRSPSNSICNWMALVKILVNKLIVFYFLIIKTASSKCSWYLGIIFIFIYILVNKTKGCQWLPLWRYFFFLLYLLFNVSFTRLFFEWVLHILLVLVLLILLIINLLWFLLLFNGLSILDLIYI